MASSTATKVPPGFRFHPTDEELVDYYLKKKVESQRIDLDVIREIDLYKIEPWDLQERCKIGSTDQDEWYFFSHKDKKYPTGTRTNRATAAGFWKATGRDKAIYSKHKLVGMRKTLVFYRGRAPNGQKTDWIMHEYRLENCENGCSGMGSVSQTSEEGWAVCRVFKKRSPNIKAMLHERDPMMGGCCFEEQMSSFFAEGLDSPKATAHMTSMMQMASGGLMHHHGHGHGHHHQQQHQQEQQLPSSDAMNLFHFGGFNNVMQGGHLHAGTAFACKQELDQLADYHLSHDPFMQLPQLESPKLAGPGCFMNTGSNMSHVRALMQLDNHAAAAAMQLHRSGAVTSSANTTSSCSSADNNSLAAATALLAASKEVDPVTDWRVLDRLVASQLSQDAAPTCKDVQNAPSDSAHQHLFYSSLADADQLSDKQHEQPASSAPGPAPSSPPSSATYNPSNDIDLWSFAKRDLASKQL
ncbi:hypothetical protein GOP47_0017329 [Adiantum capillus-veneris]|uniref:NAC domain-containing protein n=1 Tax=Adiantum capillus-veneris TaxID=13818 RepID=A0A9D4UF47_ADICA|nr:hypothetical protein GOP47_0017329 [Adiantum capillus-veneris]